MPSEALHGNSLPYMRFHKGGFSCHARRFLRRFPDAAAHDGFDGARRGLLYRRGMRFSDETRNPAAASTPFAPRENRFLDGCLASCCDELGLCDLQFELIPGQFADACGDAGAGDETRAKVSVRFDDAAGCRISLDFAPLRSDAPQSVIARRASAYPKIYIKPSDAWHSAIHCKNSPVHPSFFACDAAAGIW